MILILLVQVPAIGETKSKPATRINLDTADYFDRIVIEGIWCMASHILSGANFSHWLEVLVDREVESDTREKLVRPIQQYEVTTKALRIAVQNPSQVR